jgi:hypothetical protein
MKLLFYYFITILLIICSGCNEDDLLEDRSNFPESESNKLIFDRIGNKDIVVIGNPASDFIVSFEHQLSNGHIPELEIVNGQLPIILKDEKDNLYNVFGQIVIGEDRKQFLLPILSYQSYWFAIAAFFPGIEIHERGGEVVNLNLKFHPNWLIPTNNIFVGSGFDAIPSIDHPKFMLLNNDGPNIDQSKIPADDELIIGIIEGGEPKAFPHKILNWHEIVNLKVEENEVTITFCPLTGTAIGWKNFTPFGVSGLLYNNNLIAFDRNTESLWSQMLATSVQGKLIGKQLDLINLIETKWSTWNAMYPNTKLLTRDTGYSRDYETSPYRGYIENNDLIFYPSDYNDNRLLKKQRVHAIVIGDNAKVYTFKNFK